MTRPARALTLVVVALGIALRLVNATAWPPGPWVDEAYAIRAARLLPQGAALFGTTALTPPDAGFVNSYTTNLYLRYTAAVDRLAGGGMRSFRSLSIGPSLALLLLSVLLAWELLGRRRPETRAGPPVGFLAATLFLATSMWLLTTGRWGWDAVATSSLVVLASWLALVSVRQDGPPRRELAAFAAGAVLGLSQYGYVASRLALLAPIVLACWAVGTKRRDLRRPLAAGLLGLALVFGPLALHLARHPERALARVRELVQASPARETPSGRAELVQASPARETPSGRAELVQASPARETPGAVFGLARNVVGYGALFLVRGDPNERHGSPFRPIVPVLVTGLAALGLATAGGRGRFLGLLFGLFLLGGLLTRGDGVNAYRISLGAPFLAVLAGAGAEAASRFLAVTGRRLAAGFLLAAVVVSAAVDVLGFASWARSPRTWGAFGGPERELADALSEELSKEDAQPLLQPYRAARNPFTVDVLLGDPSGAHAIRLSSPVGGDPWLFVPAKDVLLADKASAGLDAFCRSLDGREVARGADRFGGPPWVVYRLPVASAAAAARASLDLLPLIAANGRGLLEVSEEGVYTLASHGGATVRLDGRTLFDPVKRPKGILRMRLGTGRHELTASGSGIRFTGPDGFDLALEAVSTPG